MTPERLGLLWGVTVFSGAGARLLAAISGLPGVVLLLLSGLLIGRSGLGLVEPLDLGPGLGTVVGLLVSLVLFDGGLNLRLPGDTIRSTVQRIAILRLLISLGAGLVAAHWLAGLNWSVAAVFSAIVLATGPTVVTPLVRQIRLAAPLGDVLEAEGLVLEPIGAVLALLLLELVLGNLHGWRELVLGLLERLGGGPDRRQCWLAAVGTVAAVEARSVLRSAAAAHAWDVVSDVRRQRVAVAGIGFARFGGGRHRGGASPDGAHR